MTDDQIVEAMLLSSDPHIRILGEVLTLLQKKAADYNANNVSRDEYWPFGITSFVQMLWTKVLRLRSLADSRTPKNESVEDTAKDLINYSLFLIEWIRRVHK